MKKNFVTIGERLNGRISKSEVYGVDEFIKIILDRVALNDMDVINSLDAYGKVNKIKRNLGRAIDELISKDAKGVHRDDVSKPKAKIHDSSDVQRTPTLDEKALLKIKKALHEEIAGLTVIVKDDAGWFCVRNKFTGFRLTQKLMVQASKDLPGFVSRVKKKFESEKRRGKKHAKTRNNS